MFVGSAGLPLFNDVDEQAHFDVIHKFARGYWPVLQREYWDRETAEVQVLYGSYEFLNKPEAYPGGVYPPPVRTWAPSRERDDYVDRKSTALARSTNHEAHSPPVYYLAAAAWYELGRFAGLDLPNAVYWTRFLNVPLAAALIATAFLFCTAYFSPFVALAVPTLVAFFPSTIFFSISSDVLSPLAVLLATWLFLRWRARESPGASLSFLAGTAAAAAFLVKLPNVVVLATCGMFVAWGWRQSRRRGTLRKEWTRGAQLLLAMSLPIACWMLRNQLLLGDFLGTSAKVRMLGWEYKPLTAIFDHPLFSWAGQQAFWGRLLTSFYIGDMTWHSGPAMKFAPAEMFFLASFALLPAALGLVWLRSRRGAAAPFHAAGVFCALILGGSVVFLIVESLVWEFGQSMYPSRDYPYLNSGRLVSGAIVPFLALYASSVETLFSRVKLARTAVIALSVTMMVLPQAGFFRSVIRSRYNWFHLAAPRGESDALTGLGLIALGQGRIDEATAYFSLASAANPANVAALANLGMAAAARGDDGVAVQAFTQALEFQKASAELHNSRGAALALLGAWDAAAADYREAVRLAPQAPLYRFPLAHALARTGQAAAAGREYAAALQASSRWPERGVRGERQVPTHPDPAMRMRLAARAVQRAEQADGTGGGQIEALDELAAAYADAQRFEEAGAALDPAIAAAEQRGDAALAARFRERQAGYRTRQPPR